MDPVSSHRCAATTIGVVKSNGKSNCWVNAEPCRPVMSKVKLNSPVSKGTDNDGSSIKTGLRISEASTGIVVRSAPGQSMCKSPVAEESGSSVSINTMRAYSSPPPRTLSNALPSLSTTSMAAEGALSPTDMIREFSSRPDESRTSKVTSMSAVLTSRRYSPT